MEVANRYAAADPITPQLVRDLTMQDRLGGVYMCDNAYAWEELTYIPVVRSAFNVAHPTPGAGQTTANEVSSDAYLST